MNLDGLILRIVVFSAATSFAPRDPSLPTQVEWATIRPTIASMICVVEDGTGVGRPRVSIGEQGVCATVPFDSTADRLVAAAVGDAVAVLYPLPDSISMRVEHALEVQDPELQDQLIDDAFLADRVWVNAIVRRVEKSFAAAVFECVGCPSLPDVAPWRVLGWGEFAPYLTAFVHPAPSDFSFRVCGIQNGTRIPAADSTLARAGLLAAQNAERIYERIAYHIARIRAEIGFDQLTMEAYRQRLADRLQSDSIVRDDSCRALRPFLKDFHILLTECSMSDSNPDPSRN